MLIAHSAKTNWVHLTAVIAVTLVSFYFIKEAFAKPFAEFRTYNEIRLEEIEALSE